MKPATGQVVMVFRSRLREETREAYVEQATRIAALAATMPGYVEHKGFTAEDGERLTLVTFADQPSHDAWRDHPTHREAQRAGIAEYYSSYSISVATTHSASFFERP